MHVLREIQGVNQVSNISELWQPFADIMQLHYSYPTILYKIQILHTVIISVYSNARLHYEQT